MIIPWFPWRVRPRLGNRDGPGRHQEPVSTSQAGRAAGLLPAPDSARGDLPLSRASRPCSSAMGPSGPRLPLPGRHRGKRLGLHHHLTVFLVSLLFKARSAESCASVARDAPPLTVGMGSGRRPLSGAVTVDSQVTACVRGGAKAGRSPAAAFGFSGSWSWWVISCGNTSWGVSS